MNQNRTKLTQELQQSKKDYNVLQADMEKVTFKHVGQRETHTALQNDQLTAAVRITYYSHLLIDQGGYWENSRRFLSSRINKSDKTVC